MEAQRIVLWVFFTSTFLIQGATLMDPVSFIRSLEIEDSGKPSTPSQGKDEAAVDAGSLVSLDEKLTAQHKEDILDSTLLAQLAANKKYDRYEDPENWYKFYLSVMGNIGWVMQGTLNFNKYQSHQDSFQISQVVLGILEDILGKDAHLKEVVQATIKSLEKEADALTLYEHQSSSANNGNFQILPCTADKNGQVTVFFLGSHFKGKTSVSNYFFSAWKTEDISLFYATDTILLNEEVYSQVREQIKKKLGKRTKELINNLPI